MAREVNFTDAEKLLLEFLKEQKGSPVTTLELLDVHYPNKKDRPFFARESLVMTLATIMKKVKARKEKFKLKKTDRRGPHPAEYWIEE